MPSGYAFARAGKAQYAALRDMPCVTKDGQPVELMINAGLVIDLPHIDDTGSAGIGLFRTELQFHGRPEPAAQLRPARALSHRAGRRGQQAGHVPYARHRRRSKALPYMETVIEEIRRSAGARSGLASTGRDCCAARFARRCGPAAAAR